MVKLITLTVGTGSGSSTPQPRVAPAAVFFDQVVPPSSLLFLTTRPQAGRVVLKASIVGRQIKIAHFADVLRIDAMIDEFD